MLRTSENPSPVLASSPRPLLSAKTEQAHPHRVETVFFELTNACNFKCNFCPIQISSRPKKFMAFSLFQEAVDEIAAKNLAARIGFHILGEPLLYPRIFEAIRHVKSRGLQAELSTNGALLTGPAVSNLMHCGLDLLSISLETVAPEEHAARGTAVPFDVYYQRILTAVAAIRQYSQMQVILTMMNTSSRRFFDLPASLGVNARESRFREKLAQLICDLQFQGRTDCARRQIAKSLRRLNLNVPKHIRLDDQVRIYIQLLMDWGGAFTSENIRPAKIGFCGYALRNIGILNDGRVTMCCGDYDGHTSLGNIGRQPLESILASEQAQAIRAGFRHYRLRHPYCQRCFGAATRFKAFCKGLLSIYLFKLHSHPLEAPEIRLQA